MIGCPGGLPFRQSNLHIVTQYGIANEIDNHVGQLFASGIALLQHPRSPALDERASVVELMVVYGRREWHKHGGNTHRGNLGK